MQIFLKVALVFAIWNETLLKKVRLDGSSNVLITRQPLRFQQATYSAQTSFTNSNATNRFGRSIVREDSDEQNCKVLPPKPPKTRLQNTENLQRLLSRGMNKLVLNDKKDVVLVLGNTGCGKTTFTQIVAGDTSKLHSVETQSGDLVIIDDYNRIGFPSTKSKTLIPELVVDSNSSTVYYDCPGFDDNRSPESDITSNFFIKKVTDHAESVKLLFLVVASSVKSGHDRNDFEGLVNHAAKFIKNISKLKGSIALIVTKVSSYSERGRYLSTRSIQAKIVEFIMQYNQTQHVDLQNPLLRDTERVLTRARIAFLNNILETDSNGNYFRIGFSRSPDACGMLSTISSVSETRAKFYSLLGNLTYISVNDSGFGFTLKPDTVLKINDFVKTINDKIIDYTKEIAVDLEKKVKLSTRTLQKPDQINTLFQNETIVLNQLILDTANTISIQNISNQILNRLSKINFHVSPRFFQAMSYQGELLDFFEMVTERPAERNIKGWMEPIDSLTNLVKDMRDWQGFLNRVHTILAEHSFRWKMSSIPALKNIDSLSDLNFVWSHITNVDDHITTIYATRIGPADRNTLYSILEFGLRKSDEKCTDEDNGKTKLTVTGNYVALSEHFRNGVPSTCPNATIINIIASDTVFIDTDMNGVGKELDVSIISPKWEVIASRNFNLKGKDGENQPKGENGMSSDNPNGRNGEPGGPGGNGGLFWGVGSTFINIHNLYINTNGGNGGHGGAGGDGHAGKTGTQKTYDSIRCLGKDPERLTELKLFVVIYVKSRDTFLGGNGTNGGHGGDGGRGGTGGIGGVVDVDFGSYLPNMPLSCSPGNDGIGGAGGTGGAAGLGGVGITCTAHFTALGCYYTENSCNDAGRRKTETVPGADGYGNYNANNQKYPKQRTNKTDHMFLINEFRKFYLMNMDSYNPSYFNQYLDSSDRIFGYYNVGGFVEELLNLEQMCCRHQNTIKFEPYYDSLLKRIVKYASKFQNSMTKDERKVLNYIYAASLSKVVSLKNSKFNTMVTDTEGYFGIVSKQVERLRQVESRVVIDEHSKSMQKEFDAKIAEALWYIDTVILPSVESIQKGIDSMTQDLIADVSKLLSQAQIDLVEMERAKTKFESMQVLRHTFSGLKVVGTVASFLGPKGAVIGGVIGGGASLVESLVLDDNVKSRAQISLPPSVVKDSQNIEFKLKAERDARIKIFEKEIRVYSSTVDSNTEQIGSLKSELGQYDKAVKELKVAKPSMSPSEHILAMNTIKNARGDLISSLEAKKKELESADASLLQSKAEKGKFVKSRETALTAMRIVNNVIRSGEVGLEIYNKYQNDANKLDELENLAKGAEGKVKDLKGYQQNIYDEFIPMIQSMHTEVGNVSDNLNGQSTVGLDMSRFQVASKLKEFKRSIKQFTQGFEMEENFLHFVEKLEEGMEILIDLYNHMEKYEENKKLTDYMANIASTGSRAIQITDPQLSSLLPKLELIIKTNLFHSEYETAMHAFKQWVFPFANFYLQEFNSPITNNNDLSTLTSTYANTIQELNTKLTKYKTQTVSFHDTHLIHTYFSSYLRSSHPFFVWENEKWQNSIRILLAGKPVQMKSDVTASAPGKGAIKFKLIELNLNTKHQRLQNELDELLLHYTVYMTHSGKSYFRFQDEYFVMRGTNQTIRYNFEKDGSNQRLGTNNVYNKFKNGDFMLSPYTYWTFQLKPAHSDFAGDIRELDKFAEYVDLELIGSGTYVDESATAFDGMNLRDYYEVDDSIQRELKFG